jgi:hypothetical protein
MQLYRGYFRAAHCDFHIPSTHFKEFEEGLWSYCHLEGFGAEGLTQVD